MADFLSTGVSGLLAYQTALATTGHNISNVNTAGFSRQRTDLATRPPEPSGASFIGSGVNVVNVRRAYDQFAVEQVRTQTSLSSRLDTYYSFASQVDQLLADPDAGLAPVLQDFFDAVQSVSNDPSSIPARQVLISQGGLLADRFHAIDERLTALDSAVNSRLEILVGEVNALAGSIAGINREIAVLTSKAGGQKPNDLLDQRDELLRRLAAYIPVATLEQDDGALNVFVGNGQSLVVGGQTHGLRITPSPHDVSRFEVAVGSGGPIISGYITAGELGGVLDFRDHLLLPARNALGRIAMGLASAVNAQHAQGLTLEGRLGGEFFNVAGIEGATALEARPSTHNRGDGTVRFTVDPARVSTSDYRLDSRDGTNFTLTRLQDGAVVGSFSVPPGTYVSASEGLTIVFSGVGIAGDSFQIEPTRAAARHIAMAVTNVNDIAAAGPLRAEASVQNLGTATITNPRVTGATDLPAVLSGGAVTFAYDPDGGGPGVPGFTVSGALSGFLPYDPATQQGGATFDLGTALGAAAYTGITFSVAGVPLAGDRLEIGKNDDAVSDNRNALALAALQTTRVLEGGTSSLPMAYGQMVSSVGSQTSQLQINSSAQRSILEQAVQSREAVSGVNLDEEAANLVRFQQAYQASAQVIAAANTLFQTLLDAVRR